MRIILDGDKRDYLDWLPSHGRTVEIRDIAVGSERRQGKGSRLIKELIATAPKTTSMVYAITRISNTIAHQFYESNGFRLVGRLHCFYRDSSDHHEHALVYGLDL